MDLISIQQKLQTEMKSLDKALNKLKERSEHKAHTESLYAKELSKTMIGLRNGREYKLDDEVIKDPVNTLIEKLAKGICYKEQLDMNLAESSYKNCILGLQVIQTKITALQSMNKYMDKV